MQVDCTISFEARVAHGLRAAKEQLRKALEAEAVADERRIGEVVFWYETDELGTTFLHAAESR